jgi:acyl carrier protein
MHPASPSVEEIEQDLVALLVQQSEERLSADSIALDQHLYDCGYVDSLSAAPFIKAVEARFGVSLKESQLIGRYDTVSALARHLHAGG